MFTFGNLATAARVNVVHELPGRKGQDSVFEVATFLLNCDHVGMAPHVALLAVFTHLWVTQHV